LPIGTCFQQRKEALTVVDFLLHDEKARSSNLVWMVVAEDGRE
jgi:hypothetical protein